MILSFLPLPLLSKLFHQFTLLAVLGVDADIRLASSAQSSFSESRLAIGVTWTLVLAAMDMDSGAKPVASHGNSDT